MPPTAKTRNSVAFPDLRLNQFVGPDGKTSMADVATLNRWAAELVDAVQQASARGGTVAHTLRNRLAIEEIASGFTEGSVIFAAPGGSLTQDNATFFWDDTNNRLGLGKSAPTARLSLAGTGATNGVVFGDDAANPANLYRSAADVLKTDDSLIVAGGSFTLGADVVLSRSAADILQLATGDSLVPQTTGQDLGATGNRWDLFAQTADFAGAVTATSTVDFGGATSLKVPVAAGAAPTTSGHIAYDSTANQLEYGDNGTNRVVANLDEAQTFTSKTLTTPIIAQISNTGTLTLPTSTDTLVGRDTTDTLTNKTLTLPVVNSTTVGGLPGGTLGQVAVVTDALAPAWGATVAAGGAAKAMVWYDGATWTVIGI